MDAPATVKEPNPKKRDEVPGEGLEPHPEKQDEVPGSGPEPHPGKQDEAGALPKCDEFLSRLKDVPGLDDTYRVSVGLDANLGENLIPESGMSQQKKPADWRGDGYTQG